MAVERWCEIRDDLIVNTILVDPEDEGGQEFLATQADQGVVLMPEADALAVPYAYAPPPFHL